MFKKYINATLTKRKKSDIRIGVHNVMCDVYITGLANISESLVAKYLVSHLSPATSVLWMRDHERLSGTGII